VSFGPNVVYFKLPEIKKTHPVATFEGFEEVCNILYSVKHLLFLEIQRNDWILIQFHSPTLQMKGW
jgi:hypothetical protein